MIPGFVLLGALAVLFQLLVVIGFYGYVRHRHPVADPAVRKRVVWIVGGSAALVGLGQLAALGAVGALWVTPALSLDQVFAVQDAGLLVAVLGYAGIAVGFVLHGRAAERRTA